MLKKVLILLLILIILGLYFYTSETKLLLQKALKFTGNTARQLFDSEKENIISEGDYSLQALFSQKI